MTRERTILLLILLVATGIFLIDVLLLPTVILPGPPYFVAVVVAAYFLSPREATVVAGWTLVLRAASDLMKQTPIWLMVLYLVAIVLVSFLSIQLSARARREAALAAERERLRAEAEQRAAELAAANKELQAFAYSVAHDLRAPARQVTSFSQLLLQEYADKPLDERGKEYLQFLSHASQKEGRLIDDLLKLSRVTRAEMRRQPVDLSNLAQTIVAQLRKGQPDRQVEVTITPGVVAGGDPTLLRTVLEHLLENAWKFTARRPVARVEFGVVRQDGKQAYFVRDNGVGFDMAYVGKLFGAFQRLHRADEFSGTGIGLAIVQRIVQRHGGQVWAEGAVDKGATFYFTLSSGRGELAPTPTSSRTGEIDD